MQSDFANKTFEGQVYTFAHLAPMTLEVVLTVKGAAITIPVKITFGCHCFTEEFDTAVLGDHHRYAHRNEVRAFNTTRFECSLQLPGVMNSILTGTIYRADKSCTYVTQIRIPGSGQEAYSVLFSMEKRRKSAKPAVELFVKSAYLSQLKHSPHAQRWRFEALTGEIAQVF